MLGILGGRLVEEKMMNMIIELKKDYEKEKNEKELKEELKEI